MSTRIAPSADVDETARLGDGTSIWHLAQIREGATLGADCIVSRGAYIGTGVRIGRNCKIQNYAMVYEPAVLGDGVFVGPAAVLTNDLYPRAVNPDGSLKSTSDWQEVGVIIHDGASMGANSVCIAPVTVGAWALVAAGAVVTADVPSHALVAGTPPARSAGLAEPPVGWSPLVLTRGVVQIRATSSPKRTGPCAMPRDGPCDEGVHRFRAAGDRRRGAGRRRPRHAQWHARCKAQRSRRSSKSSASTSGSGARCVAVNSGTSGLHLGLLSAGVKAGDEVIVPSFTFAATANSVALVGATPVFADIDPITFCLDPESVAGAITDRTVGIMPVHLYGHPAEMTAMQELADRHGLEVFEDAAQAHGASLHGTPVGSFGSFGMFSLYPTKNMTSGEGGMVSVATPGIERLVRLYRNQGMQRQYENEVVGFNNRMTDIHAAIGRVQLTKVSGWTKQRQENAAFLTANLVGVATPKVVDGAVHVYHQYTVRIPDDRDGLAAALKDEYAVGSGMFYRRPSHRLPPFHSPVQLPETDRAARECLSLPVHPSLSEADLERIVTAVNALSTAGG